MLDQLAERVNADANLVRRGRHVDTTFMLAIDDAYHLIRVTEGRIVSIPRRVNGELYGSFMPGSKENLQRALDGLIEFLPSRTWFELNEADGYGD